MSKLKTQTQKERETERQSAELDAMSRMLSVSEGTFSLSIAICNSPALRDYLITRLKENGSSIEEIRLTEDATDIFNFVSEKVGGKSCSAIFIAGIEKLIPSDKEVHTILKSLNATRELWKKTFSCPVVFWIPEYVATILSVQARDLWSWLSHQFEFFSEDAHVATGVQDAFAGNIIAAGNLEAEQKHFRIAELEQRIEETGETTEPAIVGHKLIWLNELAYIYMQLGKLDQAESIFRKSLEINEKLGRLAGMAGGYGNLGLIYHKRGDLDKAQEMQLKALEINENLESLEGMATGYGNLGVIYQTQKDLDKAQKMYLKALEIDEKLGRLAEMANQYGNLGLIYKTQEDLDKAQEMILKSLEIDEKLGSLEGMATSYGNLGVIYRKRGDLDKAQEMFLKAMEINEKLGSLEGKAISCNNLGVMYKERGNSVKAREYWKDALDLYQRIGMPQMVEHVKGLLDSVEE